MSKEKPKSKLVNSIVNLCASIVVLAVLMWGVLMLQPQLSRDSQLLFASIMLWTFVTIFSLVATSHLGKLGDSYREYKKAKIIEPA